MTDKKDEIYYKGMKLDSNKLNPKLLNVIRERKNLTDFLFYGDHTDRYKDSSRRYDDYSDYSDYDDHEDHRDRHKDCGNNHIDWSPPGSSDPVDMYDDEYHRDKHKDETR